MSNTTKIGYVVLGPAYEYNDEGYDAVGDKTLTVDKVFLTSEEAEDCCKQIWIKTWASLDKDSFYSNYSAWHTRYMKDLNEELLSIGSNISIKNNYDPVKGPISELEYAVLKKYWSGPNIAYVKRVPIA